MDINQMITEAAAIKRQIDGLKVQLKDMTDAIYANVTIPAGKQSSSIVVGDVKCKIANKETYTWDQAQLNNARATIGDDVFLKVFTYEWKPVNKRACDAFLATCPDAQRQLIHNALTVKQSSSVSFEEAKNV